MAKKACKTLKISNITRIYVHFLHGDPITNIKYAWHLLYHVVDYVYEQYSLIAKLLWVDGSGISIDSRLRVGG